MLVAQAASRYREMNREFGRRRVGGAVEPSAAPRRKRARETRDAFDVKKEVFKLGEMPRKERNLLQERFQAELVDVRGLLAKADHFLAPRAVKGGAAPSSSPGLAAAPRSKAERSLVSMEIDDGNAPKRRKTSPIAEHREARKMTPAERERLAFSLAALSAELSAHAVEFLQKQGQSSGRHREIEVDVYSMEDAALFELKMHVDKLIKTRDPSPAPNGKIVEGDGSHQDEECVDICGGVSPPMEAIARSPLQLEILEYGAVFDATGLVDKLLSPLPQKYLALAEKGEEEYVDICGDASPVVIQNLGAISGSPSISAISDSGSDSSSDSGSDSESSDSDSGPDSGSDMDISPAPAVLPTVNDDFAPPSEPAPVVIHIAEQEKVSNPAPAVLPMVNGDSAPPSEPAPEVVQIAEREKGSSPAPAVLPKVNGDSQPLSEPAPEVVVNAEQEKLPDQPVASPPARSMRDLIAQAQEKRRREDRSRARQELAETERSAMTSDRVHPVEMDEFGIVEHIVSQQRRSGVPSRLLEQLGLFLKAGEDDGGEEEEDQQPASSDPGVEDLEEGEFRL